MDFNTNVNSASLTTEQLQQNISRNSIIKAIDSATSTSSTNTNVPLDRKQLVELDKFIIGINEDIRESRNYISYDVHEDTNTILVKVLDSDTDEIIREFPSVNNLDFVAKVREKVGLMLDTTQ